MPLSLRIPTSIQSTGFKYYEAVEGEVFTTDTKQYNHILFLLEGELKISCNEFINQQICEKEFIFIPIAADVKCKVVSPSHVLLFTFDDLINRLEKKYFIELQNICAKTEYVFAKLPFCESIEYFIRHLVTYVRHQMMNPKVLHDIKQMELLVIFMSFYTQAEIASFFIP